MVDNLSREVKITITIGLFVFAVTLLLSLVLWSIIKHIIIHHRKQICKYEPFCILCDNGYCIKCDGYKNKDR